MPPQRIAIASSAWLVTALGIVHLAAAAVVWLSAVPLWLKVALTLAMVVSLVLALSRTAVLRDSGAIVALEIREDGRMSFQSRDAVWRECELLGSSFVSPRLTILNLKPLGSRRPRHVVLVPDNVDADDFRRLRVWLRWGIRPETEGM